jgi:hypothetical protein
MVREDLEEAKFNGMTVCKRFILWMDLHNLCLY